MFVEDCPIATQTIYIINKLFCLIHKNIIGMCVQVHGAPIYLWALLVYIRDILRDCPVTHIFSRLTSTTYIL